MPKIRAWEMAFFVRTLVFMVLLQRFCFYTCIDNTGQYKRGSIEAEREGESEEQESAGGKEETTAQASLHASTGTKTTDNERFHFGRRCCLRRTVPDPAPVVMCAVVVWWWWRRRLLAIISCVIVCPIVVIYRGAALILMGPTRHERTEASCSFDQASKGNRMDGGRGRRRICWPAGGRLFGAGGQGVDAGHRNGRRELV